MRKLLTISDVAEILGISVRTLHDYSYRHVGPPVTKVGRHNRYDPEALEAWIRAQTDIRAPV